MGGKGAAWTKDPSDVKGPRGARKACPAGAVASWGLSLGE